MITIPEKLKIVYPNISTRHILYGHYIRGVPAFPVDASQAKMLDRAIQWAKHYYSSGVIASKYFIDDVDNKPINDVKIIGTDHRKDNTIYKIMINGGFIFDMQERVFIETVMNVGICKGGTIQADFIWTRERGYMRLVRIGSELYNTIEKNKRR